MKSLQASSRKIFTVEMVDDTVGLYLQLTGVFILFFANMVNAETFQLNCQLVKGNSGSEIGTRHAYIVNTNTQQMKSDCENCPWGETLYWGDDFIVLTNAASNRSSRTGSRFVQSSLTVLKLDSMLRYDVMINKNTFLFFETLKKEILEQGDKFDVAPLFNISQCSRSFN